MSTAVMVVGIGTNPKHGGTDLASLEAEIDRAKKQYQAPPGARVIQASAGSSYQLELVWTEDNNGG